jgi:hypothetical protein
MPKTTKKATSNSPYSNMSVADLKKLLDERKIEGKSKITKKESMVKVLDLYDVNPEDKEAIKALVLELGSTKKTKEAQPSQKDSEIQITDSQEQEQVQESKKTRKPKEKTEKKVAKEKVEETKEHEKIEEKKQELEIESKKTESNEENDKIEKQNLEVEVVEILVQPEGEHNQEPETTTETEDELEQKTEEKENQETKLEPESKQDLEEHETKLYESKQEQEKETEKEQEELKQDELKEEDNDPKMIKAYKTTLDILVKMRNLSEHAYKNKQFKEEWNDELENINDHLDEMMRKLKL